MSQQERPILHVIDSLGCGGAEILLMHTISLLPEFNHVVVYLNSPSDLIASLPNDVTLVCLNYKGVTNLPFAILRLKKIIKQFNPQLVHSHLLVSNLITRLALPKHVPLFTTVHSVYSLDAFSKSKKVVWMERLSIRKRHNLIGVSKYVINDYINWVDFRGNKYVLYNFIPNFFFNSKSLQEEKKVFRCIAVGNLKEVKNYSYLLKVFEYLKEENITLDIYGEGSLRKKLQQIIEIKGLKVTLKGASNSMHRLLPKYDLFIQASIHEGFGISVIEAMASQVPVFVSDIPVFREITSDLAHFFPLDNEIYVSEILKQMLVDKAHCQVHVDEAYRFVKNNYSQQQYIRNLLSIYSEGTKLQII